MKRPTFFICTFLLLFAFHSKAQELNYNKQYGFNGSTLLKGLIDLPTSPYQISIKTYGEEKNKRLQIGLTLNANLTVSNNSNFSGGFGFQIRSGKERFEDFGKDDKWRVFYGVDGVYGLALNSFVDNVRLQFSGGIAPFVGLQYRINERLSIFTEASYQAVLQLAPSSDATSIGLNGSFLPPAAIWVAFDFYKKEEEKIKEK